MCTNVKPWGLHCPLSLKGVMLWKELMLLTLGIDFVCCSRKVPCQVRMQVWRYVPACRNILSSCTVLCHRANCCHILWRAPSNSRGYVILLDCISEALSQRLQESLIGALLASSVLFLNFAHFFFSDSIVEDQVVVIQSSDYTLNFELIIFCLVV